VEKQAGAAVSNNGSDDVEKVNTVHGEKVG